MRDRLPQLIFFLSILVATAGYGQSYSGFVYPVGDPLQKPGPELSPNGYAIALPYKAGSGQRHTGVDLANGEEGGIVRAVFRGVVTHVQESETGWGHMVRIQHTIPGSEVVFSQYAHLKKESLRVQKEDTVETGDEIGRIDCTGNTYSTQDPPVRCESNGGEGPHLHFEIKSRNQNDCGYLPSSCSKQITDFQYFRNPLDFVEQHRVVTCSAPAPVAVATYRPPSSSCGGSRSVLQVAVSNGFAFALTDCSGLRVVDVSRPGQLREVGFLNPPSWGAISHFGLAMGTHRELYLAVNSFVRVVDVSDPTSPREIAALDTEHRGFGLRAAGGLLFISTDSGLRIYRRNGNNLELVTTTPFRVYVPAVEGASLYGIAPTPPLGEIVAYDISQPLNPLEVGTRLSLPVSGTSDMVLRQGLLYLTGDNFSGGSAEFAIVDVSNPDEPAVLSAIPVEGAPILLSLKDQIAYIAARNGGVRAIDVSRPETPAELAAFTLGTQPGQGAINAVPFGGLVYSAYGSAGLVVIDLGAAVCTQ